MIPFVSLGCGWGGSLSQLSLDGLKLPGQVYSAVTPWAGGVGSLSPGQPSESVTLWPPILASLLPCIHLFNSATTYFWLQQNESLLTELQTPLTLISFSDFNWLQLLSNTHTTPVVLPFLHKCLITACVGPYSLQAETDRMQCGQCFSLSSSPPRLRWKHHAILTCWSIASLENSL